MDGRDAAPFGRLGYAAGASSGAEAAVLRANRAGLGLAADAVAALFRAGAAVLLAGVARLVAVAKVITAVAAGEAAHVQSGSDAGGGPSHFAAVGHLCTDAGSHCFGFASLLLAFGAAVACALPCAADAGAVAALVAGSARQAVVTDHGIARARTIQALVVRGALVGVVARGAVRGRALCAGGRCRIAPGDFALGEIRERVLAVGVGSAALGGVFVAGDIEIDLLLLDISGDIGLGGSPVIELVARFCQVSDLRRGV